MAGERTLFERILKPDERVARTAHERKQAMSDSVVRHMAFLLNSRQGCCLTLSDYGMPDLDCTGTKSEMRYELERAIRDTIAHYEPRLRRIRVTMEESEEAQLVPRFAISAELDCREDFTKDVAFTTVVDPSGKIMIE